MTGNRMVEKLLIRGTEAYDGQGCWLGYVDRLLCHVDGSGTVQCHDRQGRSETRSSESIQLLDVDPLE